jgi:hypothetical protein
MLSRLMFLAGLWMSMQGGALAASDQQEGEEGLRIDVYEGPVSDVGDSKIRVVTIDPRIYRCRLLSSSELGHPPLTISEWCKRYGLAAGVNAGMFMLDHRTNVGYMKNGEHVNNGRLCSEYKSVALFEPRKDDAPRFLLVDKDSLSVEPLIEGYSIAIQNLRLISHGGRNCWADKPRRWSEAALGEDDRGNILLIFSRSPYSMYDFNRIVLSLPIRLGAAQHLEGGPEASLFLSAGGVETVLVGSYETGFLESDSNDREWPIPNVLGFERRTDGR